MDAPKARILVVDDDPDMRATLDDLLVHAGFDVDGVADGVQMRQALARHTYSLAMLDLRLQWEDGARLARELRGASRIPIIMISGASDETDRVLSLEETADDFLIKPFNQRELLARVRAVLRRIAEPRAPAERAATASAGTPHERLRFGPWILDLHDRALRGEDGSACPLTSAEYRLLEALVRQPHRVWAREQLLEQTRSDEVEVFDRAIDVLILRLRRKIEPNPKCPRYICTERGLGYVFSADVTPA